jgi:hypothetical protein
LRGNHGAPRNLLGPHPVDDEHTSFRAFRLLA